MKTEAFNIGSTPALLIGEKCDKVFLFACRAKALGSDAPAERGP